MLIMILFHDSGYRCPEHFLPADARGCHTAHHQTGKQHERSVDKRARRATTPQEDLMETVNNARSLLYSEPVGPR